MAVDTEAKRWSMLQICAGPSTYATVFNPDTSGLVAIERATVLKLYGGIQFTGEIVAPARKPGGVGGRKRRPRRIMIDGRLHTVQSAAEERMLLGKYLEQQRQALEVAEPAHVPAIKARIKRAEKRQAVAVNGEAVEAAERLQRLQAEDDEILIMLVH